MHGRRRYKSLSTVYKSFERLQKRLLGWAVYRVTSASVLTFPVSPQEASANLKRSIQILGNFLREETEEDWTFVGASDFSHSLHSVKYNVLSQSLYLCAQNDRLSDTRSWVGAQRSFSLHWLISLGPSFLFMYFIFCKSDNSQKYKIMKKILKHLHCVHC